MKCQKEAIQFSNRVMEMAEKIQRKGVPNKFLPFETALRQAVAEVQQTTFETALRGMLKLPLEPPGLGLRKETWDDKMREYMKPLIAFAETVSKEAAYAAFLHLGPLSPLTPLYAKAARSHAAKLNSNRRQEKRGGRQQTVLWRKTAKDIWGKNRLLTATDMLEKLAARGIISLEGGRVVFLDENGLRTEKEVARAQFVCQINTLKHQSTKQRS